MLCTFSRRSAAASAAVFQLRAVRLLPEGLIVQETEFPVQLKQEQRIFCSCKKLFCERIKHKKIFTFGFVHADKISKVYINIIHRLFTTDCMCFIVGVVIPFTFYAIKDMHHNQSPLSLFRIVT